ncbi:MAG: hypothetical protein QUV05_16780 [Phycisphaerae bacterium]|nr:hypothetical protein [Phycisphaerae bacterium]
MPESSAANSCTCERASRVSGGDAEVDALLTRLLTIAQTGLPKMFRQNMHAFAFTRRRCADGNVKLEGTSLRYGAIVSLGAAHLSEDDQRTILGGETAAKFCGRLIAETAGDTNLGDLALVAWAAAKLAHMGTAHVLALLRQRSLVTPCYTVEAAWALSALIAARKQFDVDAEVVTARDRLLRAFSCEAGIFAHWTDAHQAPWCRAHVACFADQVYPIQALARYHKAFGHSASLDAASRCAERICRVQGPAGQWWWHYDTRNGSVIEGYPVYTVHQDAMAPMALLDLHEAGGPDHSDAIRKGLSWMSYSPEVDRCLIEDELALIWRSAKRSGPSKAVRLIRAAASSVVPTIRVRWLDSVFRPTVVDHEDRPYHLGWILHAWLGGSDGGRRCAVVAGSAGQ